MLYKIVASLLSTQNLNILEAEVYHVWSVYFTVFNWVITFQIMHQCAALSVCLEAAVF